MTILLSEFLQVFPTNQNESCLFIVIFSTTPSDLFMNFWKFGIWNSWNYHAYPKEYFLNSASFLGIMITSLITLNVVQITKYDNFWVKLLENPHAFFWKQLPKVFKLSIRKCVNPFIIIEWPEDWLTYRPFPAKFDYKNLQL